MSGATFGIGAALSEHSILDPKTGQWLTQDWGTYHVPVTRTWRGRDWSTGIAAAIGNPVFYATGVRMRELPITPEKIVEARLREGTV